MKKAQTAGDAAAGSATLDWHAITAHLTGDEMTAFNRWRKRLDDLSGTILRQLYAIHDGGSTGASRLRPETLADAEELASMVLSLPWAIGRPSPETPRT